MGQDQHQQLALQIIKWSAVTDRYQKSRMMGEDVYVTARLFTDLELGHLEPHTEEKIAKTFSKWLGVLTQFREQVYK